MTREHSPRTESRQEVLVREVNKYIREKYPVRRSDVNEILEQMHEECRSSARPAVVERFVDMAIDFARTGMEGRRENHRINTWNTQTILSAVSKFESENGTNIGKQLPLSRFVGILALCEIASARRSFHAGWGGGVGSETDILNHLDRMKELVELHYKLKRVNNKL